MCHCAQNAEMKNFRASRHHGLQHCTLSPKLSTCSLWLMGKNYEEKREHIKKKKSYYILEEESPTFNLYTCFTLCPFDCSVSHVTKNVTKNVTKPLFISEIQNSSYKSLYNLKWCSAITFSFIHIHVYMSVHQHMEKKKKKISELTAQHPWCL